MKKLTINTLMALLVMASSAYMNAQTTVTFTNTRKDNHYFIHLDEKSKPSVNGKDLIFGKDFGGEATEEKDTRVGYTDKGKKITGEDLDDEPEAEGRYPLKPGKSVTIVVNKGDEVEIESPSAIHEITFKKAEGGTTFADKTTAEIKIAYSQDVLKKELSKTTKFKTDSRFIKISTDRRKKGESTGSQW